MQKFSTTLSQRDIKIFEIIKKFGWLREDYLARYLGLDWNNPKVRNMLNSLAHRRKKHNYIVRQKIIDQYPSYWALGKNGAHFINAAVQKNVSLGTLIHNDMVANLAIDIMLKDLSVEVKTEHELKFELFGSEYKHKKLPDIVVGRNLAIEVEVSKKNDKRLSSIVSSYLDSNYDRIIYYTNNIGIANKINQVANNHPKFEFKLFRETDILVNEDYIPEVRSYAEVARNKHGQFLSTAEEKLQRIGAFAG